jgi:hypothetical protein
LLSIFQIVAALLTLTAVFAWVNHRLLKLPSNVGLLLMGLAASLVLIGLELLLPDVAIFEDLHSFVETLNFSSALLNGMLAFLLSAGALQIDLSVLRERAWTVGVMATLGVDRPTSPNLDGAHARPTCAPATLCRVRGGPLLSVNPWRQTDELGKPQGRRS